MLSSEEYLHGLTLLGMVNVTAHSTFSEVFTSASDSFLDERIQLLHSGQFSDHAIQEPTLFHAAIIAIRCLSIYGTT